MKVDELIDVFLNHESKMNESFSLVPSENILSPLARKMLLSDMYSRYFFEDDKLWGKWAFQSGRYIGEVNDKFIMPLMRKFSCAEHINVKPTSGISGMITTFASYCKSGDHVLTLSEKLGGHVSTSQIAQQLGLVVSTLDAANLFEIDLVDLENKLKKNYIKLIYIDQANTIFPVDVKLIADVAKIHSPDTFIHVDTSHINGLIFGKQLPNPLVSGASSFGGSFHKSFPGPHKAFFASNNRMLYESFSFKADRLVSHTHSGELLALAMSLIEFDQCGGDRYARQTIKNAQAFSSHLSINYFDIPEHLGKFTSTHQVWVGGNSGVNYNFSERLFKAGLIVNYFTKLPGIDSGGVRLGLNEVTKYGLKEADVEEVASCFVDIYKNVCIDKVKDKIIELKRKFHRPCYCFDSSRLLIQDLL